MQNKEKLNDVLAAGFAIYIGLIFFWNVLPIIPIINISLSGLFKVLLFGVAIFAILTKRKKINLNKFRTQQNFVFGGFFVLMVISLMNAPNLDIALLRIMWFVNVFILYLFLAIFITKKKHIKWLLLVLILVALIYSFSIIFTCHTGIGLVGGTRGTAMRPELITDSNLLSVIIAAAIPICFYFIQNGENLIKKILLSFALIFMFFAVLMTFSRTGLVGLCFVLFMLLIKHFPRKLKNLFKDPYFFLIIVLFIFIPVFLLSNILHDGNVLSNQCKRTIFGKYEERLQILDSGKGIVGDNFFTGVGVRNFRVSINSYNEEFRNTDFNVENRASHNTYLTAITEQGIFGFLLFILVLVFTIKSLYGSKYYFSTPLLISFMMLVITGVFIDISRFIFWIIVFLAVILEKNDLKN